MDNAGVYDLAVLDSSAFANAILSPLDDLDGVSSISLEAVFKYGSGSNAPSLSAIVMTTFDGGQSWRHIARFDFTTASATKLASIQAGAAKAITAYADLVSEGVNDGFLGDQIAVKLIATGSYSNSALSIRAAVR
ncbi:hypothetical protein MA20_31885 [Bradyrhizobium japonicum]|uniref:Uncharacterized protein n=1 Tax=Bradyrhizobium japonicum TaxID=375 RepID=A0A0A3XN08_BRAJP|nr:hypothetical protein [Bradyrhizobium japonicum]KGT75797.1 hypothetical protein MA20_31885 [Bradyrhizobium japonicum]